MRQVISDVPHTVPPTVAQQVFVIGSGIAGGTAGFFLARELARVEDVPVSHLAIATIISAVFTFGAAVYLVKKVHET